MRLGTADHDRRDGLELEADAGVWIRCGEPRTLRHRGDGTQKTRRREGHHSNGARPDAGEPRGGLVGADRNQVASVDRSDQHELSRRDHGHR